MRWLAGGRAWQKLDNSPRCGSVQSGGAKCMQHASAGRSADAAGLSLDSSTTQVIHAHCSTHRKPVAGGLMQGTQLCR